ncbi:hypothetical protein AK812_SmicGene18823 [Symbiodinium microadriaticum]|uniref:Uncharacterized protein n=1 Tax=Symbiodinium microadriaticum TaxID=2951 RepID=A0A1Q9DU55_SYMMI|nr:hypothetical protein AK812_SmicGene18823 [Symbiodinium microadriaticum]CAE7028276.1 unnamed protein product [Symbiodinium sp. KB8]
MAPSYLGVPCTMALAYATCSNHQSLGFGTSERVRLKLCQRLVFGNPGAKNENGSASDSEIKIGDATRCRKSDHDLLKETDPAKSMCFGKLKELHDLQAQLGQCAVGGERAPGFAEQEQRQGQFWRQYISDLKEELLPEMGSLCLSCIAKSKGAPIQIQCSRLHAATRSTSALQNIKADIRFNSPFKTWTGC